jgi:hypothetical protein
MLAEPKNESDQQQAKEEEDVIPPKIACVARNRSGVDEHNTLTPRWEFPFSV